MYKLVSLKDTYTKQEIRKAIVRIQDNAWIPNDPANTDYQAYLKWIEAGNKLEPAEENV
jgi:hypothetical protein